MGGIGATSLQYGCTHIGTVISRTPSSRLVWVVVRIRAIIVEMAGLVRVVGRYTPGVWRGVHAVDRCTVSVGGAIRV